MQNMIRRLSFEHWYWLGRTPWDTGISPPELLEFIETHQAGRAIDIGCGTGTNVVTLARAGWQVTGIDFASRAIRKAKRKVAASGVQAELYVRDVTDLHDITGPFDLALDLGCFHGVLHSRRTKYLEELDRILARGGYWLLYAFLKTDADHAQPGMDEAAIRMLATRFMLLSRRDGFDNRGRNSAWFLFQKQTPAKDK
jgi:cyclopropane fatty-acyl-phospholipid synthase-like methyltransferase